MSGNSINISGLDFTKLPDDFKLENVDSAISFSTGNKLHKIENLDISDGLNKDETALIISEINIDDNEEEISNEEIHNFCKQMEIAEDNEQEITMLLQNMVYATKEVMSAIEADETKDVDDVDDTNETEDDKTDDIDDANDIDDNTDKGDKKNLQVNVQSWGSAAEEGNKYANDCLEHIMKNHFPDLQPYSEEWFAKETEIMNANPDIYGNEQGEGTRKAVGGEGRRNAVLYDSDKITLPGLEMPETGEKDEAEAADDPEKTEGDSGDGAAGQTNAPKIPKDAKEQEEKEDLGNGIQIASYTDADGNIVGKKQFNGEDVMWESTITKNDNGGTTETRAWTNSGQVQVINYDSEGKEISINSTLGNGITSKATFTHAEDGTKSAEIQYFDENNQELAKGTQTFDADGSYVENIEYTSGENISKTVDTTYTNAGIVSSKNITANNQKCETIYENGLPKNTTYYDDNKQIMGTEEYTYNDDGTYKVTLVDNKNNKEAVMVCDSDGNEITRTETEKGENGEALKISEYENNTLIKETEVKYADENNTVKSAEIINEFQADGETLKSKTYNKYDKEGKIIDTCTIEYDENGEQFGDIKGNADIINEIDQVAPIVEKDVDDNEEDENNKNEEENKDTKEDTNSNEEELRTDIATAKAQALHAAMDRAGTDEETVKEVINNTTGQDLVDVINQYEEMYGSTLEDAIKNDFSWLSGESDLLRKLDSAKAEVKAYENMIKSNPDLKAPERNSVSLEDLHKAQLLAFKAATSNRTGTDERVLFDMFQEMEDTELKNFIKYAQEKDVDIKTIVENETSFETKKSLIQRIETLDDTQAKPRIDIDTETTKERGQEQIRADIATTKAQALHAAMDRAGTDEDVVTDIINNTQGEDLVDIINEYERLFNTTLEDAIKDDFSWLSGESDLLRKLDSAKAEVKAYENMIKSNPDLKAPERNSVSLEDLHKAQLQTFKAATSNRYGTDEKVVYQMLQNGSMTDDDIKALDGSLKSEGSSLITLLELEFSGETLKALIRRLESLGIERTEEDTK